MRIKLILLIIITITCFHAYGQTKTFTLGSSVTQVINSMGQPSKINKYSNLETWYYNYSTIEFRNGIVYEWNDAANVLNVSMGTKEYQAKPATLGSSFLDVVKSNGTPKKISKFSNTETWYYNYSTIEFRNGIVYEWNDAANVLNVSLGEQIQNANEINLNSSKIDVINFYGTPNRISKTSFSETWYYGSLTIEFSNKSISHINDYSKNYDLRSSQTTINNFYIGPGTAENGDIRGADNDGDGRIEPVYVKGYYKKNGTYVRSHYRAAPRRK